MQVIATLTNSAGERLGRIHGTLSQVEAMIADHITTDEPIRKLRETFLVKQRSEHTIRLPQIGELTISEVSDAHPKHYEG